MSSGGINVLIVDDNDVDILISKKNLEMSGLASRIDVAKNGREALSFLEHSQINEMPDVILLDINMPVMDGWAFMNSIDVFTLAQKGQPRIFMVSSSLNLSDNDKAAKNPMISGFITKPFNQEKLRDVLQSAA
ncbi:MAG: response regulator [Flavobacteriales bacterium]|jgi:CheY-like chemotaxis protein|nr:response regulator [Flavobacteriales bacterium]